MKKETKETTNLSSLIVGIFFIIIGLVGSAITLPANNHIIAPFLFLVAGAFLALMGGLRKWG